jgi:uncharacterized protein YbcI
MPTRAELESQIAQVVSCFAKDSLGRGPLCVRAHWLDDLVLVRCRGPLTIFEQKLAAAETTTDRSNHHDLARQLRKELLVMGQDALEADIARLTGRRVLTVLTDMCVAQSESVFIFVLDPSSN